MSEPNAIVSPQILDAVNKTNRILLEAAPTEGIAVVYQQVAQAMGLAVQDATDYQRNLSIIAATATGLALAQLLAGINTQNAKEVLSESTQVVAHGAKNLTDVGQAAAQIVKAFKDLLA